MSQSPDQSSAKAASSWIRARQDLFQMMTLGRSFSGHERNCCFLNTGQRQFANISASSGLDFADDGRAIAIVDWDQDGDQDLWISNRNAPRLRFFRNNNSGKNSFLAIRLQGNGSSTNRDAVGARLEVITSGQAGKRLIKTLHAGEGFLAQSSKWLHFGLAESQKIEKVIVRWPGGHPQEFTGLDVNRRYQLIQGMYEPSEILPIDRPIALSTSAPHLPPHQPDAHIPLVTLLPLPAMSYQTWSGEEKEIQIGKGKPVLLNLWSSRCRPCLAELKAWSQEQRLLRSQGIEVVALSVDRLDNPAEKSDSAENLMQQLQFPFKSGWATRQLVTDLQRYHDELIFMRRPLPLPVSFLIDSQGRLSLIRKGMVPIESLLKDLQHAKHPRAVRLQSVARLAGRSIAHEQIKKADDRAELKTRYQIANYFQSNHRIDEAAKQYNSILRHFPRQAEALNGLGVILSKQGDLPQARERFQEALRIDSSLATAHNNLGTTFAVSGDPVQAAIHFEEAIRLQDDYAEAHDNLGSMLAQQGKLASAEAHFQRAIDLDPQFAQAYNNLASVFAAQRKIPMAISLYERAIQLDPGNAQAQNNLGSMLAQQGKITQSIKCFQRALHVAPNFQQARDNLRRAQKLLPSTN